eukprot:4084991-Amphidinium_carterae.1
MCGATAMIVLLLTKDALALSVLELQPGKEVQHCLLAGAVFASQQVLLPASVFALALGVAARQHPDRSLRQYVRDVECFCTTQVGP